MIILEFFNPEYLKIFSSLLLNKVIKNNCVVIKNIKGNKYFFYVYTEYPTQVKMADYNLKFLLGFSAIF